MEVSFNLKRFYDYLIQRVNILVETGTASIPDPFSYLQAEISKTSAKYQTQLVIAVNEAFNFQTVFTMENTQQEAMVNQTDAICSAAASTCTANDANLGALLEDDVLKHDFFSDPENMMHGASEVSTNESQGDTQVLAEESVTPAAGEDNLTQFSVSIKSESMDDNPLVEQEVIVIDDEDCASFADDNVGNSNEDANLGEINDEEGVGENTSDIGDNHDNQNDSEEEISSEDYDESDDSRNDPNYEEDDEEDNVQAAFDVAGPSSSMTLRRATRHSARVTQASSDQEDQDILRVKSRQFITMHLLCTVAGCKEKKTKFSDKDALNDHLLSAHKLKKYRCLVRRCYGKEITSFETIPQFKNHLDRFHDNHLRQVDGRKSRLTRLACHCCSKKFNNHHDLSVHYRSYHELGLFACSKDGCTFKPARTRIKVQVHSRNHWEAKYECTVDGCGKSFKQKEILDKHTLTHTGERPYPCTECDRSFNQKGTLTRHLRIHRNDKCYRCTWRQCTYSSTRDCNVITHIRAVHFKLPQSKKQQAEESIEDERDPRDYLAKD